ncbi:MAG: ABC transporter ATP-binding protein [Firmicutes bacterium]|nr:ABC transporter ATP-binding protein [Bacillota bacterium]
MEVHAGQSVGVVGESGCGKSVTAYSIVKLLPRNAKITSGEIKYTTKAGRVVDMTQLPNEGKDIRSIRGSEISMVFQEAMSSLSPVHTIGNQICEAILLHQNVNKQEAREKAIRLLTAVGISKPEQRIDEYPFQLSGGMCQRIMTAIALACNPRLVIADEPTTALDVTTQAQVLRLIKEMQREFDIALILITHDLGVVAHMVEYMYVVYLGQVIEEGLVEDVFNNPCHPYTRDLMKSIPRMTGPRGTLFSIEGTVPSAYVIPDGCLFHTRCQDVVGSICCNERPQRVKIGEKHYVSCFRYMENREANDHA